MTRTASLLRRALIAVTVCATVLVAGAPIAAADPAKPTNYRSRILEVTPPTSVVQVKVVGGDGFLDVRVTRGHTIAVEGYEGEPWLRVLADGTVQENQRSTATYLNANRYGTTVIPPGAGRAEAIENPAWSTVAHGGKYIWHDHRIHYMTPEIAPHLFPGTNRVLLGDRTDGRWVIPLTVDGKPTQIVGELLLLPAPNPLPWWALAAVLAAAGVVAASLRQRRAALVCGTLLITVGGAAALAGGISELSVVPSEAGGSPVAIALPAVALIAAAISVVLRNRATRCISVLAGAATLVAWAILRIGSLSHALPLSGFPAGTARLIVSVALGTALGGALAGIRSGALALAAPDDLAHAEGVATSEPTEPPQGAGAEADLT